MGLSTNSTMLYGSSLGQGLFTAVPWAFAGRFRYVTHISEATEKELRKVLSLCSSFQTSIGCFITYSLGYLIGWRSSCFVMVAIT